MQPQLQDETHKGIARRTRPSLRTSLPTRVGQRGEIEAMNDEFERMEEERRSGKRTQELLLETLSELKNSARQNAIATRAARVRAAVGGGGNRGGNGARVVGGLLHPRFGFTRNGRAGADAGEDGGGDAGVRGAAGGGGVAAAAAAGAGAGTGHGAAVAGRRGVVTHGRQGAGERAPADGQEPATVAEAVAAANRGGRGAPATPRNHRQRAEDGIVGSLRHLMSMTPSVFNRDPW